MLTHCPADGGRRTVTVIDYKELKLLINLERAKGFEPSTPTLARLNSPITHDFHSFLALPKTGVFAMLPLVFVFCSLPLSAVICQNLLTHC